MGNFKKAIYKQMEEINERMTEFFSLLKECTKGKAQEKVLVREDNSKPVTKYVNAISLIRLEDEKVEECDEVVDIEVVKLDEVLGDG
ncbi:hypothetical protein Tco_0464200 [Tanacetum coccineum]